MKLTRLLSDTRFDKTKLVTTKEIYARRLEDEIIQDGQRVAVRSYHPNGIFSEDIFGKLNVEHEYSCSCSYMTGKSAVGVVCPKCNSEVKEVASNVDRMGWIDVGEDFKVIKYVPYLLIERVIGRNHLREIIETSSTVDQIGFLVPERKTRRIEEAHMIEAQDLDPDSQLEFETKEKYYKYGITSFEQRFYEIFDYYYYMNGERNTEVYDMFKFDFKGVLGVEPPTKDEVMNLDLGETHHDNYPFNGETVTGIDIGPGSIIEFEVKNDDASIEISVHPRRFELGGVINVAGTNVTMDTGEVEFKPYKFNIGKGKHTISTNSKNKFLIHSIKVTDGGKVYELKNYKHNLPDRVETNTEGYYDLTKLLRSNEEIIELYDSISSTNEEIFTQYIPVISLVLRPAMRSRDGLRMDDLNKLYMKILGSVEELRFIKEDNSKAAGVVVHEILQADYFELSKYIMDTIRSKDGLIRNQIAGTRINFSARSIISPIEPGYRIDEITLPYVTFLHLYRFEIIRILVEREIADTELEAEKVWHAATLKFSPMIKKIVDEAIENENIGVLINRNPTIAYGSMIYVKVAKVKGDFKDLTMNLSNSLLTLLAGDYDGDVLNIISVKDPNMREILYNVFSPEAMVIDSNRGGFNRALNAERDQILGLNSLLL